MRFPFFATNKQEDEREIGTIAAFERVWKQADETNKNLDDLEQKVRLLEGRIKTLEEDNKHGRKKRNNIQTKRKLPKMQRTTGSKHNNRNRAGHTNYDTTTGGQTQ